MAKNINMADPIVQLPTDNVEPNQAELEIVNTLFKKHGNTIDTIVDEMKDCIIAGILFLILSLPQVDTMIASFVPSVGESKIILTVIKAIVFIILFYFIKNYTLSQKK